MWQALLLLYRFFGASLLVFYALFVLVPGAPPKVSLSAPHTKNPKPPA